MNLSKLLSILPFYDVSTETDDITISHVVADSRHAGDGSLFVCVEGFTVDGHEFVEQAVNNGASAILAEKDVNASVPVIRVPDTTRAMAILASRFYGYPTQELPLIGVTGTNGKTTITYLLESIFNQLNRKAGIIGTIQMKIGQETYPVQNTTPDALNLQKSFHKMIQENVDTAIMEVSSHALDMGRVQGCDFDIAVFTNLSQDHLDYHEDMKDYLHAKSLLFAQLGNTYNEEKKKFAVINKDVPEYTVLEKSTAQHVMTYGCHGDAQVKATDISLEITKTTFTMDTPVGSTRINSRLIGKFNVYNMLAASAAAICAGVPLDVIKDALESVQGVDGRFQPVDDNQEFATVVDYAHAPDSLENVLQTIKEFAENNVYVVVGCGGDRDKSKRPLMASIALQYADQAIFTSDNPRTEDPQAILDDMTDGLDADHYTVIENRQDAIYHAVSLAEKGDIVLIAGKGHETYQEIGNTQYNFDDREVAKEAIQFKVQHKK
ncbi:UDP-N-acetylmuramoyl-L-alanyl-D-glutamate--2,6-diaminopimelate ligase [Lentibacillus sp. CBA3610]|uniref:UDP-N-acetylmuramoyl-L-alanyl-D-glutamate--2, 6-diaminopimelate ligase n=1 Tax=Lentibacillus sp. CBA3610 TaxID=2518176 RepID=UPI001595DE8B|nr:UDP-N-acetylmuramoyl-L-alanyl-D-glutamate--2,6-diaminopimelate ligase [Lentibacillus sp. CBA3610]QKY68957.1 UDP-N-acetylmuramoyl-L-alanyl-D-glutamate--2,6-diaminopimelate ligase [Lentibacillus sp. CBA3610]